MRRSGLSTRGSGKRGRRHGTLAPPSPFAPASWTPPHRGLVWCSTLQPYSSFGLVARALVDALSELGVEVAVPSPAPRGLDETYSRLFRPMDALRGRLVVRYDPHLKPIPLASDRVVIYSTFESTRVPPEIVAAINQTANLCCVPCRQNREAYAAAGVTVPIRVLPHGVDGARFRLLDRPRSPDAPFVFGAVGSFSARKGIDLLIRAFQSEFGPAEPVRLLLKNFDVSQKDAAQATDDPRIEQVTGFAAHGLLLRLLGRMDAFVLPSRGEGFGLTGLEAMATGLPVIATNWSGPADYLDSADSLPLEYHLVEAGGIVAHGVRFDGLWAEPDVDHLRTLMRWVYEHRDEAAAMGRRASARVRRDWTWDRPARQLRDDLDMLASGISPS